MEGPEARSGAHRRGAHYQQLYPSWHAETIPPRLSASGPVCGNRKQCRFNRAVEQGLARSSCAGLLAAAGGAESIGGEILGHRVRVSLQSATSSAPLRYSRVAEIPIYSVSKG